MSAICGIVWRTDRSDRTFDPAIAVTRMLHAMSIRGRGSPVVAALDTGLLGTFSVGATSRSLATDSDRTVAVAIDGTVYADASSGSVGLPGHVDAAAVSRMWSQLRPSFPEELNGEFAAAVLDETTRTAILARDHIGVRPLYYSVTDEAVVFASEMKAIVASGLVEPRLNYEAINAYLSLGYAPAPHTLITGVLKLRPASRLTVKGRDITVEKYWEYPSPNGDAALDSEDAYREELLRELTVAIRLRTEQTPAVLLSGGIDSGLIVSLLAREGKRVKTFTVGFAEAGEANELDRARGVADHFGTDHREVELSFEEDLIPLDELIWALDEPVSDLSSLGLLALSRVAAEDVESALSGAGADGLLGGFPVHVKSALAARFDLLPTPVGRSALWLARFGPNRIRRLAPILSARDPLERLLAHHAQRRLLLSDGFACGPLETASHDLPRGAIAERLGNATGDALQNYIYVDEQLSAVDSMLHYMDRAAGARGLELRVPFFDRRVVELCARIPTRLKVRFLTPKYILRQAARDLVPASVLATGKVGFFNSMVGMWLSRQIDAVVADYLLDPAASYREFLSADRVRRLMDEVVSGEGDQHLLLAILFLEVWLSTLVPQACLLATSVPDSLIVPVAGQPVSHSHDAKGAGRS